MMLATHCTLQSAAALCFACQHLTPLGGQMQLFVLLHAACFSMRAPPICCRWIKDIEAYTADSKVDYPIIADLNKDIATL